MEIIFTLILLIGFGINSHRYEANKIESQKQVVSSYIQQEINRETTGGQGISKEKADLTNLPETSVLETSLINKSAEAVKSTTAKGKYISVRIHDGNG